MPSHSRMVRTVTVVLMVLVTCSSGMPLPVAAQTTPPPELAAYGCVVSFRNPITNNGLLEVPATISCETELANREVTVELWQRNNNDVWVEVPETDSTISLTGAVGTAQIGLDNISCRKLENNQNGRFRTKVFIGDGSSAPSFAESTVNVIGRDCLAGLDANDLSAAGLDAGSRDRVRRPPKRAEARNMKIKCRYLRDEPRLLKKAGCPERGALTAQDERVGNCGKAWIWVSNAGNGYALISYGWSTFFPRLTEPGSTNVTWYNNDASRGGRFDHFWRGGFSGSATSDVRTGSGSVIAFHRGALVTLFGLCELLDPNDSRYISD